MNQACKLVPAYSASNTLASTYLFAASNSTLSSPSTQLNTNPSYAFRLTSSKIPKYVPTPLEKKNGSHIVPGHIAPKLPALRLRQQRMPRYPLDLLAPLRLHLLKDVYTLLAVLAHVGEGVRDPVALGLRTGWAVAPGCRRLRTITIEEVRVPGDRERGRMTFHSSRTTRAWWTCRGRVIEMAPRLPWTASKPVASMRMSR
jgi:hypothetical protein